MRKINLAFSTKTMNIARFLKNNASLVRKEVHAEGGST